MVSDKPSTTFTARKRTTTASMNHWIPKKDREETTTVWTEVISKQNKRSINDPFAGMKSSIDYEQEIERLKQIVPKVPRQKAQKQQQQQQQQQQQELSRSNSPDTLHSFDSDMSLPEPQSIISKEERNRFLAFVRSWTGDYKGSYSHNNNNDELMNNNSLWEEQLPWTTRPQQKPQHHTTISPFANNNNTPNNNNFQYDLFWQIQPTTTATTTTTTTTTTVQTPSPYTYWENQSYPINYRHNNQQQQPIGMGRSFKREKTFATVL